MFSPKGVRLGTMWMSELPTGVRGCVRVCVCVCVSMSGRRYIQGGVFALFGVLGF